MAPKRSKKAEPFAYEVSRYQPRIKSILQDSIAGVLDSSAFSVVKGGSASGASGASANRTNVPAVTSTAPVSLRQRNATGAGASTTTPSSSSAAAAAANTTIPSRSVVMFVIGGMSFAEIRAAYEVAEQSKREVYIGNFKSIM
jgi:syntaxin-binding protein 1